MVLVFMRGLLRAASARVYFSDAPGNADDPILALVPAERRATLIAQAQGNGLYHWTCACRASWKPCSSTTDAGLHARPDDARVSWVHL